MHCCATSSAEYWPPGWYQRPIQLSAPAITKAVILGSQGASEPSCTPATTRRRKAWSMAYPAECAGNHEGRHLGVAGRSEEHTSELQSHLNLVCRLLLEKQNDTSKLHRDANLPARTSPRFTRTEPYPPRHPARGHQPTATPLHTPAPRPHTHPCPPPPPR